MPDKPKPATRTPRPQPRPEHDDDGLEFIPNPHGAVIRPDSPPTKAPDRDPARS